MLDRRTRAVLSVLTLAAPAAASTWIVDDNGGPGVDFTTIAAAEAVASPGDVILVRPGSYPGFQLDIGVGILGDPGASISGLVTIQGLSAGPRATLAGFATRGLRVQSCSAPVLLEDLTVMPSLAGELGSTSSIVDVVSSTDVRLRGVTISSSIVASASLRVHGLTCTNSRVELSQCAVSGVRGVSCVNYTSETLPWHGGDAVWATTGALVRIGGCALRGGNGGSTQSSPGVCGMFDAANGGAGLALRGSANAIVSGLPANLIQGGEQGTGNDCSEDGLPGSGVVVTSPAVLHFSGATPVGQNYFPGCGGSAPAIDGTYAQPPVPDPILTFSGAPHAGTSITYTVHGEPGAHARLRIGRQLSVLDVAAADEDQLLVPLRTYDLGTLPAGGTASFTLSLPAALPRGFLLVAQGTVQSSGGALALTHSLPITLR